jgi:hypothetical protein
MRESQETDMSNQTQTQTTGAARFILQSRAKLLVGLRVVPVAALLFGLATLAPAAGATSCSQPSNIAVNGGRVSNQTTLDLSADGGFAVSTADGGNNNVAVGGPGGLVGNGGDAAAGNGGVAVAAANGGMIDLDDVNSGNNRGNTIAVSTGSSPCSYYGPSNVSVNGGSVSNETTLQLSANGGLAVSSANGGNGNVAVAGAGGLLGNGGNASAGLGGVAVAQANGGAISVGDINSGNNRGTTILVGSSGLFGRASNVHINGGTVRNSTTLAISADGGTAIASANGGDNNVAVGGPGGLIGTGGDAAAGNGGVAVAAANGGSVSIGDINSGGNSGNTIVVGNTAGNVAVDGGTVSNETTIDISADGGTAVATADGGDGNVAVGGPGGLIGDGGDAAAGNGGVASSDANGGSIAVGDVNSGGNSGNTIIVGN